MTLMFTADEPAAHELFAQAQELFVEAAGELAELIRRLRAQEWDGKGAAGIKDVRAALQLVLEERNRIEKLRKEQAGAVRDIALDFDAARVEIGSRLARLRDAGCG